MKIVGFDVSLTSTGRCIMDLDDENLSVKKVDFMSWHTLGTRCVNKDNVVVHRLGTKFPKKNMFERKDILYGYLLDGIEDVTWSAFEGYAYGKSRSSSSIVQLAEFSGELKHIMWGLGKGVVFYPPAVIKKFATGNGTADKIFMSEAFRKFYPEWYPEAFNDLPQDDCPHADMVDAFWIAETLRCHMLYQKLGEEALPKQTVARLLGKSTKKSVSIVETELFKKTNDQSA